MPLETLIHADETLVAGGGRRLGLEREMFASECESLRFDGPSIPSNGVCARLQECRIAGSEVSGWIHSFSIVAGIGAPSTGELRYTSVNALTAATATDLRGHFPARDSH